MKYLTFSLILTGAFVFTSCGWSENQKEAARNAIDEGFTQGLNGTGKTVDPKVKEAWLDCVMEKVVQQWTFDEITENPELMDKVQHDCADEVGLSEAVEVR